MALNLVVDRVVRGKIYPSLAKFQAEPFTKSWREFHNHWPNTIPLRLQEYCEGHGIPINIFDWQQPWPHKIYYPIALSWFDFSINYLDLLPSQVCDAVKHRRLCLLFYYHEGDNPERIQQRLDYCVQALGWPKNCYVFVSSNSAADTLDRFVSFQDSELWYWHRNQSIAAIEIHNRPRSKKFTVLNRLHKWWRAAAMADLQQHHVLEHSYWSYCEAETDHDNIDECAIELDAVPNLRAQTHTFLQTAPYFADSLSQDQRNDHHLLVQHFYHDAYCNIVMETMFDWDQSGGVLLSEKTFKPIKHGQMFFIAGGAGSLEVLRSLGYRTFDSVLDNSYDQEHNNTCRWLKLRDAIVAASRQDMHDLYNRARPDVEHNQKLFVSRKHKRVSTLLEKLHVKSC